MKFYYVYILQSEVDQKRFYTGFTENLDSRLKSHNTGQCHHTSKYRPWCIKTAVAFGDHQEIVGTGLTKLNYSGKVSIKTILTL